MSKSDPRSKITIEDLLHLKKSERPSAGFWSNFESELRQKQLSALVEKRAWWHDLPRFFARRIYLPIGATAILTFTLVSVKYYTPAAVMPVDSTTLAPIVVANSFDERSSVTAYSAPVSSLLVNRADRQIQIVADSSSQAANVNSNFVVSEPAAASISIDEKSPSARSIAANLARLEQSEPELLNSVLGSRLSSSSRVRTSTTPVVELASLQISGSKRTRLLAHYNDRQPSASPTSSDAVRERLSRRLGDSSDFNDSLTRIGLKGDQVSLKF